MCKGQRDREREWAGLSPVTAIYSSTKISITSPKRTTGSPVHSFPFGFFHGKREGGNEID